MFVLELSLPKGMTYLDATEADEKTEKRAAAALALEVTEKKIALGLVEGPVWERHEMRISEARYKELLARGARVSRDVALKREVSRGSGGDHVTYIGTFEIPSDGSFEQVGRPRAEAAAFWKPMLDQQRATLAALAPAPAVKPATPYEVRARWRYVVFDPPPPSLEGVDLSGTGPEGTCVACLNEAKKRGAIFLWTLGAPGVDLSTRTADDLWRGVALHEASITIGTIFDKVARTVRRPTAGRLSLRQEASCPARVVRLEQTLLVGNGSGVIAVPDYQERVWHELRDATCAIEPTRTEEIFGPAPPVPEGIVQTSPARFWISQHEAELARLARKQFKLSLPR